MFKKQHTDRAKEAATVASAIVELGLVPHDTVQEALQQRVNGTALSDVLERMQVDADAVTAVREVETKLRQGRVGEIALDVVNRYTAESCASNAKLGVAIAARRAKKRAKGENTDVFLLPDFAR